MADQGFVTTPDGARLFYRLVGRGAATVIVPNGLYFADQLAPLWQDRAAVVYDLRNRGRSDAIAEPALLSRGVLNDLDDLDAVRAHFKLPRVDLVGHSYVALVALHYAEVATVTCPVLIVHGSHDRSAPYAAGRAWAARLPNARLLTVPDVAHAPWIEAPGLVIPALQGFLDGAWPAAAERVLA